VIPIQSPEVPRLAWIIVLVMASLALSRVFACATPFAALATLGALTLRPREALSLVLAIWVGNQVIGFGLLHYPWTVSTLGWGIAIAAAAVAALAAARVIARLIIHNGIVVWIGAFAAAFAAYELVLFAATAVLPSGGDAFAAAVIARICAINGVALGLLLAAHQFARVSGLTKSRPIALPG